MICGVFGLPRAGKTTFLTYLALKALKGKSLSVGHLKWKKPIGEFAPYERVFCNFPIEGTYKLDFDALGVYDFSNSLILIDEIMLVCDSRDWKNFRSDLRNFLALHGHYKCDLVYCSQGYKDTDLRIRNLTERIFYIEKFGEFTRIRPIDKGFQIDEQINEGYTLAPQLSATYLRRKKYYRYFNSFDAPAMPENPALFWDAQTQPESNVLNDLVKKVKRFFSPDADGEAKAVALAVVDQIQTDSQLVDSAGSECQVELEDPADNTETKQILDFKALADGVKK